jgi:hypothetical protein
VFNPNDAPASVTMTLFADGARVGGAVRGPSRRTRGDRSTRSSSRRALAASRPPTASILVQSDVPVFSYAAVIDNATSDPYLVTGSRTSRRSPRRRRRSRSLRPARGRRAAGRPTTPSVSPRHAGTPTPPASPTPSITLTPRITLTSVADVHAVADVHRVADVHGLADGDDHSDLHRAPTRRAHPHGTRTSDADADGVGHRTVTATEPRRRTAHRDDDADDDRTPTLHRR